VLPVLVARPLPPEILPGAPIRHSILRIHPSSAERRQTTKNNRHMTNTDNTAWLYQSHLRSRSRRPVLSISLVLTVLLILPADVATDVLSLQVNQVSHRW
jgi:hypothetical protein